MNGRDVLITTVLLLTGLAIGYALGLNADRPAADPPVTTADSVTAVTTQSDTASADDANARVAPVALPDPTNTPPTPTAPPPQEAQPRQQIYPFSLSGIPLLGDPATAKVAIVLFSDFQ